MRLFIVILSLIHCLAVDGATLRPAGSYPLQSLTHAVAVGDVNRDGKLDVITGDDSKSITVWLGDGKGGLTFRSRNSVGGKVQSVQAGDFNGDGNSDIVCAYHLDGIPTYIVAILLGNGDGTFRAGPSYQLNPAVGPLAYLGRPAVADLNRDGKPDIIFTSFPVAAAGSIIVMLGNGDGTFQPAKYFQICEAPESVATADFNGDGILDLAVGCAGVQTTGKPVTQNSALVLRGAGDGSFSPFSTIPLSVETFPSVAAGDLDADGHADLAVGTGGLRPLAVLWGNGLGSFQTYQHPQDNGTGGFPALADMDGDGRLDIITLGDGGFVNVYLNAGDRSFRPALVFYQGAASSGGVLGDFNNDGKPDVVAADQSTLSVLLNAPSEFNTSIFGLNTFTYGDIVQLTLTISSRSPSFSAPSGIVTWISGATVLGTSDILPQLPGQSWTPTFSAILPAGIHNVTIRYSGDSLLTNPSPFQIRVDRAPSAIAATVSTLSPTFGQPIGVSIRVSSSVVAPAGPTGTVSLIEGGRELASAVIDSARQITAVIPSVSGGMHVIQAAYSGDSNFEPSSQNVILTVRPAASSISLTCLPNPAGEGEAVLCTVRASDNRATGTVNLREGASVIGSSPLIAGRADVAAAGLSQGRHGLTAAYSGDNNFLPSESANLATDVVAAVVSRLATHDLALASPQSLVSIYGKGFVVSLVQADTGPLPSQLGGLRVIIVDATGMRWVTALYFVAPGQIQFVVPDVALGAARLEIASDGGVMWTGALEISNVAPGLFSANGDGKGVAAAMILKVAADGTESYSNAFRCGPAAGTCSPEPIAFGDELAQTYLILPATGLRNASSLNVILGSVQAEVISWGEQPQYAGFDQVKVRIPRELSGRGLVEIAGDADGKAFNPLFIQFD